MKLLKKGLFGLLLIFSLLLVGCFNETDEKSELELALDDCKIDLLENIDLNNIKSNIKFISSERENIETTWNSSNNEVINEQGIVFRNELDTNVLITVRVTKGIVFLEKEYELKVIGNKEGEVIPPSPVVPDIDQVLKEALNESYIDLNGNISINAITSDVRFINGSNKDVSYRWISNNLSVISDTGKVVRPSNDTLVTITLEVTYKEKSLSKDFIITVLKKIDENNDYTYDVEGKKSKYKPSDLPVVYENQEYNRYLDLVSYIYHFKHLPKNYLTKAKAESMGWSGSGGNVWNNDSLRGKYIGGDTFRNKEGILPHVGGNVYVELDVNCRGGQRGSNRIVYNRNTFDIYYTSDHYRSFTYMIGA